MIFQSTLEHDEPGHAFLSPSKKSFIRYDDEKLIENYLSTSRAALGTDIHEFCARHILFGDKLPNSRKQVKMLLKQYFMDKKPYANYIAKIEYLQPEVYDTIIHYTNDAIHFGMTPEVKLTYDPDICFGTADAISFENGVLKIHDLKTGVTPASIEQLLIYAAIFCLENGYRPNEIKIFLAIYQMGGVIEMEPTVEDIAPIMDIIVHQCDVLSNFIRGDRKYGK